MDWTDIVELVHETVHRVETNNPGRRINISINQNLPVCSIDKVMLEQVLYNLLNNAAVHTATDSIIEIVAYCHGTILEFMVEDSGAIDKNAIEKVINKFSRDSPPNSSGSGLGLSIAKGFTEALGGHIHLKKNAYGGASFTVIIPVRTTELVSDEQV
jgi:two-component system sensor histidine kinase KdpD